MLVFVGTELLFLEMVLMACHLWNRLCLVIWQSWWQPTNRNCFRCSLEPGCLIVMFVKQTFVIFVNFFCKSTSWSGCWSLSLLAQSSSSCNSGMSTASLGEMLLANGVTVLVVSLFEVIATFFVCLGYHDCDFRKARAMARLLVW